MEPPTNLPAVPPEQPKLPLATLPAGLTKSLSDAEARLAPCGAKTGQAELTACLVLVAPVGMTERERAEWISIARNELRGIPADLMQRGCAAARKSADHPAKILPAIFREVGQAWEQRKKAKREIDRDVAAYLERQQQAALPPPDVCTPEDARRIIAEVSASRKA